MQWPEPADIELSRTAPSSAGAVRALMDAIAQQKWQHLEELLSLCRLRWRAVYTPNDGAVIAGCRLQGIEGGVRTEAGVVLFGARVYQVPELTCLWPIPEPPATGTTEFYLTQGDGQWALTCALEALSEPPRVCLGYAQWRTDDGEVVLTYHDSPRAVRHGAGVGAFRNGVSCNGTSAYNGGAHYI